VEITIGRGITAEHDSEQRVVVQLGVEFGSKIQTFFFPDFDARVSESDFNLLVTNSEGFS